MTKNELISILKSLPGDPDIVGNHPTIDLMWYDKTLKHSNRTIGKIGRLVWDDDKIKDDVRYGGKTDLKITEII